MKKTRIKVIGIGGGGGNIVSEIAARIKKASFLAANTDYAALRAVAGLSTERKSGARGLRSILENTMLEVMYDIPSQSDIKECVISEEVVLKKEKPILIYETKSESA